MGVTTAAADEPSNTGEILAALDKLSQQKRLSTLVDVAQLLGLTEISTEHSRRLLLSAFDGFEGILSHLDRCDRERELRDALKDARPYFTASQIDEFVTERLGGRR